MVKWYQINNNLTINVDQIVEIIVVSTDKNDENSWKIKLSNGDEYKVTLEQYHEIIDTSIILEHFVDCLIKKLNRRVRFYL